MKTALTEGARSVDGGSVGMLENIRNIGLFMIAAQAVIHFAPGGQYEKYIKLISSVIILFLFLKPFVSGQTDLEMELYAETEQVIEEFREENLWQTKGRNADDFVLEQLEAEVKDRLNKEISGEMYAVYSVSLIFDRDEAVVTGSEYDLRFQRAEIVMTKETGEGIKPILVEDIVIREEGEKEEEIMGAALQYRKIFAGILGIEQDRVEVTCVGGW